MCLLLGFLALGIRTLQLVLLSGGGGPAQPVGYHGDGLPKLGGGGRTFY